MAGKAGNGRQSVRGNVPGAIRNSRDPRPVGSKAYMVQCAQNVVEVLAHRGFAKSLSCEKLLKDPSCKDFYEIFRFLINQVDPGLEMDGKMEDEVPTIMRRLKYPVEVNRSKLQAISGPNTWPQLLAVLDWLAVLVRISEGLITPIAECQATLQGECADEENHILLRCLHENYVQFIVGREDKSDEEKLRQVYEERTECVRAEKARLEECLAAMEQRLGDFRGEHERLLEMQRTPALLERECGTLRAALLSFESRVERVEAETTNIDAEERAWQLQDQEVRETARRLTEQVQNQAYSKKDVERLKCERARLSDLVKELVADNDRIEQDVWELKQKESRRAEVIGRTVRQVNELLAALHGAFQEVEGGETPDLTVCVDLSDPNDSLASLDFTELVENAQASCIAHSEAAQQAEVELGDLSDELRAEQEELALKERECKHLRERIDQLGKIREQFRDWSSAQLAEARRTAEATEDARHAVAVGTAAPTIRDSAEIDKLKLTLNAIKTQGASELEQLKDQVQRDEERFEEHRRSVIQQLGGYTKDVEEFIQDFESRLEDETVFASARRAATRITHGGC